MTPLVSVCLPNLNTRPFLEARIETILAQTLSDWEMIVCDSHSEDGAWAFFQEFEGDPRIHLHQVPREGVYAGWNECLARARGKYIYIATSDDTADCRLLERMTDALEAAQHGVVGSRPRELCVCRYARIDALGSVIESPDSEELDAFLGKWSAEPHVRSGLTELLIQLTVGCHWDTITAALFHRKLLGRTGLFRTDLREHADIAWRTRAVLASDVVYVPETLATWRVHDDQVTWQRPRDWARQYGDCIRETLEASVSDMPSQWRTQSDWIAMLLLMQDRVHYQGYCLDRAAMRRAPHKFLAGGLRALASDPSYFWRRLRTAFSWQEPEYVSRLSHLQHLVAVWGAPWPPERLDITASAAAPATEDEI